MSKILIIGADGQLGADLVKVIPAAERIPLTIKDIDITDKRKTAKVIFGYKPDLVINTAAFHQVDKCEENRSLAFSVNAEGPRNVAEACLGIKAGLAHLSTDYVFDGRKGIPYVETDQPNPLSVYAESKLAGEQAVRSILPNHYIVRSTGLYGAAGCLGKGGTNFVEGMIKRAKTQPELKVVDDEILSPTYTLDLARKIYQLIQTGKYGLYHIVNHGFCSWHEFAARIFELLGWKVIVQKVKSSEFPAQARRPAFSALSNANLAKLGLDDLRPWAEALQAYLIEQSYIK